MPLSLEDAFKESAISVYYLSKDELLKEELKNKKDSEGKKLIGQAQLSLNSMYNETTKSQFVSSVVKSSEEFKKKFFYQKSLKDLEDWVRCLQLINDDLGTKMIIVKIKEELSVQSEVVKNFFLNASLEYTGKPNDLFLFLAVHQYTGFQFCTQNGQKYFNLLEQLSLAVFSEFTLESKGKKVLKKPFSDLNFEEKKTFVFALLSIKMKNLGAFFLESKTIDDILEFIKLYQNDHPFFLCAFYENKKILESSSQYQKLVEGYSKDSKKKSDAKEAAKELLLVLQREKQFEQLSKNTQEQLQKSKTLKDAVKFAKTLINAPATRSSMPSFMAEIGKQGSFNSLNNSNGSSSSSFLSSSSSFFPSSNLNMSAEEQVKNFLNGSGGSSFFPSSSPTSPRTRAASHRDRIPSSPPEQPIETQSSFYFSIPQKVEEEGPSYYQTIPEDPDKQTPIVPYAVIPEEQDSKALPITPYAIIPKDNNIYNSITDLQNPQQVTTTLKS